MTKQKIVRLFAVIAVVLFSFFLIFFGLSFFFEDKIKSSVIYNVNKSLTTPVTVGQINFSIIKHFPYAALQFDNVSALGVGSNPNPLLKAEKINLLFNFFSLFSENFLLKKIVIENAELNLLTDKQGNNNFDVFKKDSTTNASLSAEIEKLVLKNVLINVDNKKMNFISIVRSTETTLGGSFSSDKFVMQTNADVEISELSYDNISYIKNKNALIQTGISIDRKTSTIGFDKAEIKIADLILSVNGTVQNGTETSINLKIASKDARLNNVLTILPSAWIPPKVLAYKFSGNVNFDVTVQGKSSGKITPNVTVNFNSDGNSVVPDKEDYSLKNISLTGFFTNRKSENNPVSYLSFKNIKATLEGKPLTGSVVLENLSNPYVDIVVDAEVTLVAVSRYFAFDKIEQPKGIISLHGFIKGRGDKKETYRSSGSLRAEGLGFKLKTKSLLFNDINGSAVFDGNNVAITNLHGNAGSSDFMINGDLKNFYGYVFSNGQVLYADAEILSQNINLDELTQSSTSQLDSVTRVDFSNDIMMDLKVNSKKVTFRKFVANNINSTLTLKNKVLGTSSLMFQAVEGNFYLQGAIDATAKDSLLITYDAVIKNVNIQKLFLEMGNFGQEVLVEKNIRGKVNATVELASVWSKTLNVNTNRIYSKADITIENGALINFTPMLKLSRFVKGSDLQNVQFSTLKNQIEIKNRKIYIPKMDIKSTALNIQASGVHTFDNMVDYNIQMKMRDLMGKKVKQLNTEFGTIEDDGSGGLNLFLTMKGSLDNPKFAYDRKSVEQKITTSVQQGKSDFIKTLKDEFKTTSKKEKDKTEKQKELEIETDDSE